MTEPSFRLPASFEQQRGVVSLTLFLRRASLTQSTLNGMFQAAHYALTRADPAKADERSAGGYGTYELYENNDLFQPRATKHIILVVAVIITQGTRNHPPKTFSQPPPSVAPKLSWLTHHPATTKSHPQDQRLIGRSALLAPISTASSNLGDLHSLTQALT